MCVCVCVCVCVWVCVCVCVWVCGCPNAQDVHHIHTQCFYVLAIYQKEQAVAAPRSNKLPGGAVLG